MVQEAGRAQILRRYDAILLGQGLAGTLLSYELLKRGKRILVLDDGNPKAASRLAAGLMSPITGQRTALMWKAKELLESAAGSYTALEGILGRRFFFPLPLKRIYANAEQSQRFRARKAQAGHAPWLGEEFSEKGMEGMEIRGAGWLDAAALLQAWRGYLQSREALQEASCQAGDFHFSQGGVSWEGLEAGILVACLGLAESKNGFFGFLKFQPTKGEMLTVTAPSGDPGAIRYRSHFAIPLGSGRFRVGSTYDRQDLSPSPTPQARAELESSAQQLLGLPMEVQSQDVGLRPNLLGHFPVLGPHPSVPALSIFNGLGSKGALWAPYGASLMAAWMDSKGEIPEELNIQRFSKGPQGT
jgi:glycine oxidase